MNALGIAMVKNEADVIEAFVRHNLAFLDLLVVIDNDSSDGTREILTALQQEGLPIVVKDDPVMGYFQSEKLTDAYRQMAPVFQPEVVYLLDADEFIVAPSREAMERVLAELAPGTCALLPWETHLPEAEVDTEHLLRDPLGAMPLRRRREEPLYFKAIIRRNPADDARLVIEQGNHLAHRAADPAQVGATPASLPTVRLSGVALAHLPVRSVEQLSAKVVNGWHAYLVKNRTAPVPGMGYQWEQLYAQVVHRGGIAASQLQLAALDYAQNARPGRNAAADAMPAPVTPRYGTLRHGALGRHDPLAKIALNMERWLLAAPAGNPTLTHQRRRADDLEPLQALARQLGCKSIRCLDGRTIDALWAADPGRRSAPGSRVHPAELLFAGALAPGDGLARLARHPGAAPGKEAHRYLVCWTAPGTPEAALREGLEAMRERGWEPHVLHTMGYRALSSQTDARQGTLVFHPVEPARQERAQLVREMFCQMAA